MPKKETVWLKLVKKTLRESPRGTKFSEVLKKASEIYKKKQ